MNYENTTRDCSVEVGKSRDLIDIVETRCENDHSIIVPLLGEQALKNTMEHTNDENNELKNIKSSLELIRSVASVPVVDTIEKVLARTDDKELSDNIFQKIQKIEARTGSNAFLLEKLTYDELNKLDESLVVMNNPGKKHEFLEDMANRMSNLPDYYRGLHNIVKPRQTTNRDGDGSPKMTDPTIIKIANMSRYYLNDQFSKSGVESLRGDDYDKRCKSKKYTLSCLVVEKFIFDLERRNITKRDVAILAEKALEYIPVRRTKLDRPLWKILDQRSFTNFNHKINKLGDLIEGENAKNRGCTTAKQTERALILLEEIQRILPFSIFGNSEDIQKIKSQLKAYQNLDEKD